MTLTGTKWINTTCKALNPERRRLTLDREKRNILLGLQPLTIPNRTCLTSSFSYIIFKSAGKAAWKERTSFT